MTVSSADPDRLDAFVADAPAGRTTVGDLASSGVSLAAAVMSRCAGRGLSATNFGAVSTLIDNMAANEQFVRGVADALRTADRHDGIATMSDVAIAQQLETGQYATTTTDVTIASVALLGEPANSGLVDDPICAANGNFIHREPDLLFPGTSAALNVHRFYNSLAAERVGAFGAGWTSVFDVRLDLPAATAATPADEPDHVTAHLADGAEIAFLHDGDGGWVTRERRRHTLRRAGRGWELGVDDDARGRWQFDRRGRLVGWRVGAVGVAVERDTDGRIALLTHDRSSRTIALSWGGEHGDRITRLTTDDGRSVAYRYGDVDTLVRAESRAGWFDYAYDGRLMLSATDPDGVSEFHNEYDEAGRAVRQVSRFGRSTTYRYEIPGATVVTDGAGARQAMVHDARGNLVAIVDTDGAAMRATYDAHDRMVEVTSQTGDTWTNEFDPVTGDLLRRTDPDGHSQTWAWDEQRRLVATTDRAGATVRYEYEGDGRSPVRAIGPGGATATVERDEWDQPLVVTDADGVVSRFVWDRDGQLVGVIDALGNTTTMEFDAAGLLVRLLDPAGADTHIERDHGGRVVSSATDVRRHEFRYTPGGRVAGGIDPAEGAWSAVFGRHGAVASVTGATGATIAYRYDEVGNVVGLVGPDGAEYGQRFDDAGRLVAAVAPDGSSSQLGYDPAGRVVAVTDPAGRTHRRTLDPLGRTSSITAPDGAVTRWTYHPCGEVASVELADGRTWTTEVDAAGRVVAVTDPLGRRAGRTYTRGGRLASRTDPDGRTERYRYDRAGRCSGVAGADGTSVELVLDGAGRIVRRTVTTPDGTVSVESRELDAFGQVVRRTTGTATTEWERDAAGRVTAEIDGTGASSRFEFDARGLLTAVTDPAGLTTTYGYDIAGHLLEQVAPGGRTTAWDRDQLGMVRRVTDPAGAATDIGHDATGIVTSVRRAGIGWDRALDAVGRELGRTGHDGTPLARYAYDVTGRMVSAEAPLAALTTEFLWDAADHLVAPAWPAPATAAAAPATPADAPVERDAAGRILVASDGTAFRYDDAGRLVEIAPASGDATTFEYGADGLIASERTGRQGRHFTYDAAGRVASITVDGAGTSLFTYDAAGRRTSQTGPDGSSVVFGWNDLDQLVSITRASTDGEVRHLAIDVDALGRPRRINGVDVDPGATAPVAVAGVVVLGARVYDPFTHQFLSADPLMVRPGSNGGASAYTYAWQDPVNHVDPTGLRPISIEEYERMRTLEEQGRLGQAWEAIKDDPWGTLAVVGVVGAAFLIGGPVGVGILVGVGMTAGMGLATGTFSPTSVAIGGVAGGLTAGIGSSGMSVGWAMAANGGVGAGSELANQYAAGNGINWRTVMAAGAGGAVTGGLTQGTNPLNTTLVRSTLTGAATDTAGSVVQQGVAGQNPLSWNTVVAGVSGAANGGFSHLVDPPTTTFDPTPPPGPAPLALPAGSPARVVPNALLPHEIAQAQRLVDFRGGEFMGNVHESAPGIDGLRDGIPTSLKTYSGESPLGVLRHASRAEASAAKAGYADVELFIDAPGVSNAELIDFAGNGPLARIPSQGTISSIYVRASDGWIVFPG